MPGKQICSLCGVECYKVLETVIVKSQFFEALFSLGQFVNTGKHIVNRKN